MVPLDTSYSHSEDGNFMEIRWPTASKATVKASSEYSPCLRKQYLSLYVYISLCVLICTSHSIVFTGVRITLVRQHSIPPISAAQLTLDIIMMFGVLNSKRNRKRKSPRKSHGRNSGRHWGGLAWRRKGSGAMIAVYNIWRAAAWKNWVQWVELKRTNFNSRREKTSLWIV